MYTDIILDLVTAYYIEFPNKVQWSPGQGRKCVFPEKGELCDLTYLENVICIKGSR